LVDLKSGHIFGEYETLIKPSKPLSDIPAPGDKKTITKITGITNEMLEGAPSFKDVADKIIRRIEDAPATITHNHSFDKEMLDIEAERIGLKIRWPRSICTIEQTIVMKGYRLSMGALHQLLFDEKFEGAHRAKVDVTALTRCCVELLKRGVL
jgi:DNA polymerase III epsilon subunit-like protein